MITIFTPTYNREKELQILYKSLLKQNYDNFEWIIVDDGSTDNTEQMIIKMKEEKKLEIVYYKQENKGKSKAVNQGIKLAKGEIFICIDSDDYFVENTLKYINDEYLEIKGNDEIAGVCFLHLYEDSNKIVGTKFPNDKMIDTYFNIYNKHKVTGDKLLILKTEIIKKYLFPEIEGEKFVPEALMFNRISRKYKIKFINKPVAYKKYLENGYTANYFNLAKKNPKANVIYYKELYEMQPTLYNVAAYNMYCIYAKKNFRDTIKEHPSKWKALIMYIPAYIKYIQKERKK